MLFRCRRCLYPNTKPDIHFDAEGICSACQAYDRRTEIDWVSRKEQFLDFVSDHRGKSHDVIVACSGGKDSTAQIVKCKELGLNVLAVTATTDHLTTIGRRNLDNISRLCDHIEITPDKLTRAKIAKFALQEVGDISWCEHHLIWSVPAREAVQRNIPVVIYGECPQNEYGAGPQGSEAQDKLTKDWVDEFGGLLGLRLSDVGEILHIEPWKLEIYRYPAGDVSAVFLGAYFPWDGFANYEIAKAHGFESYPTHVEGSLYGYENLDNAQTGIHDHLRFAKFGYGRACDIASNHIRRGRLTRGEAIDLVHGRDGAFPSTYLGVPLGEILDRIGISDLEYTEICDRFTNWDVVDWALQRESYQSFSGTTTARSKENSSAKTAA